MKIFKFLNKSGYASRPALTGIVIGTSLVVTGIGFYAGNKTPAQPAHTLTASATLQQSAYDYAGGSGAYSREALESSMASADAARAAQGGSTGAGRAASSAAGTKTAAGASVPVSDNWRQEGADYQAMLANRGALEGIGGKGVSAVDIGAVSSDAGAAAQKGADRAAVAKGQLQTSKTASGSSGGASGSSGAGSSSASASSRYGAEFEGVKISQAQLDADRLRAQGPTADSFKLGRGGSLGGSNIAGGRGSSGGSGQQGASAMSGLNTAVVRSASGSKTVYNDSLKGTGEAATAFDGGVPNEGISIDPNANVAAQANQSMERMASTIDSAPKYGSKSLKGVDEEVKEKKKLRSNIMLGILGILAAGTVAALLANKFATAAAAPSVFSMPKYWAAIAIAAGGLLSIGLLYGLVIAPALQKLNNMQYINNAAGQWSWIAPVVLGLATAAIGISLIPNSFDKIKEFFKKAPKEEIEKKLAEEVVEEKAKKTLGQKLVKNVGDSVKTAAVNEVKDAVMNEFNQDQ